MKIMSLNIWGGKVYKPLIEFLENHSKDVDIFCFQEVFRSTDKIQESHGIRTHLFDEIEAVLPEFKGYFYPVLEGFDIKGPVNFNLSHGLAIFVKKTISIEDQGDILVYENKANVIEGKYISIPRNLAYFKFNLSGKNFIVATFHGLWTSTKEDTESRLEQSRKAKGFLDECEGEKILCGDFNLSPNTQSLAILEENLKNLVKEYNIPTTRSIFYTKNDKFADYMLVSDGINVRDFKVLQDPVSDHLPLLLEFS